MIQWSLYKAIPPRLTHARLVPGSGGVFDAAHLRQSLNEEIVPHRIFADEPISEEFRTM